MRIAKIKLSWFRGAGSTCEIQPNGKSLVLFGPNGSGKSSFVDAVEACLNGGKISHLSHEYSGRFQERGLINTHRPDGELSYARVTTSDGEFLDASWNRGSATLSGRSDIQAWDYRRTILRQEEISEFIRSSKTEKYSAILPLLGLGHLEVAAGNLRKINREIELQSGLDQLRSAVFTAEARRREMFGDSSLDVLFSTLQELAKKYKLFEEGLRSAKLAERIEETINQRISSIDATSRSAAALSEFAANCVILVLADIRSLDCEIAKQCEPLVKQRLEILSAAAEFFSPPFAETVRCPACGTSVSSEEFHAHVNSERGRLEGVAALYQRRRTAVDGLCDELHRLKGLMSKSDLASWRSQRSTIVAQALEGLDSLSPITIRSRCNEDDLVKIESLLYIIIQSINTNGYTIAPDAQALFNDKNLCLAILSSMRSSVASAKVNKILHLVKFNSQVESNLRKEIQRRAHQLFSAISTDIQTIWKIIHPAQGIDSLCLYAPDDNLKSIEVHLRFHGVDQESPRLTLSEGQRNALGLCIFLAMSKRQASDIPIILDDVIISLDRDHRSNIVPLLQKEFSDRQVLLLTHDREFFELQRRLSSADWKIDRLLAFAGPFSGIRIADYVGDFARARSKALNDPEDALANARRLMDVALAEIAERLAIPIPFMQGADNDNRTGGHLLIWINRSATRALRVRDGDTYRKYEAALQNLRLLPTELAIWGNRGVHTFSGSQDEAIRMIDHCEAVLSVFECSDCRTSLGFHTRENSDVECRCGKLQWKAN